MSSALMMQGLCESNALGGAASACRAGHSSSASLESVASFLRAGGGGNLSGVQVIARKSGLVDAVALIAAAANAPTSDPHVLLLCNGEPLAGWSGEDVANVVEQWARHEGVVAKFWKLHPPLALVDDAPGVAAAEGQISFSVDILTCVSFVPVPPVRDELIRNTASRFVLLLRVRPSPVLALLVNTRSSGSGLEQWRRAEADVSASFVVPANNARSLTCERTAAATTMPLDPLRVRNAIISAAQWASDGLPGAPVTFLEHPIAYACDASCKSELARCDWKSAALWLENVGSGAPPWQRRQDDAALHKALEYAISFLTLPGGGELLLGVWDRAPSVGGVEGIVSSPPAVGDVTHAEMLTKQLRRVLKAAVTPWSDDWLRIVAVPTPLHVSRLLPASAVLSDATAGSVLVVNFTDEDAVVTLRQACKESSPCASLPLLLLDADTAALPETIVGSACVFRAPLKPEVASVLIAQFQAASKLGHAALYSITAADVISRLPDLHVLHVQFAGAATGRAVCSPLDVAVPVLAPEFANVRYLPWRDIVSRLQWELPARVASFQALLVSPAHRVHCWNVSTAPSSRSLFHSLSALPLSTTWLCSDFADTEHAEWGAADLLSDNGSADMVLLLLCEPHADPTADQAWRDAFCAAFRSPEGPSLLLASATSARIIAVSSSALHASSVLAAVKAVAPHVATAAALQAAQVVPPSAVAPSSGFAPAFALPPPASAAEVKEAAKRVLRGEAVPPSHLLQLLKLPEESRVLFERDQREAVQAVLSPIVAAAAERGCVQYVRLARKHVAAGAAMLAMRCLVQCGCAPLLITDVSSAAERVVLDWSAALPCPAVLAVVLHQPPAVASKWLTSLIHGRAAVVVCVVDENAGGEADSPVVSGQLSSLIELSDAVASCLRFFPERRIALQEFLAHASALPPECFQRSLAALAVAVHMDSFVPLRVVLEYFFPPYLPQGPPSAGPQAAARWLITASLFHAFDVTIRSGALRMAVALRTAMRPTQAWHLVSYVPGNKLPVTVHAHFAAAVLRRAADASSPTSMPLVDRLLTLLRSCLCEVVALDDSAPSADGTQSAWFAAVQARPNGARFSNIVGAVFRATRPKNAAILVDAVRRALAPTPHSPHGAHLLVTLSRVWRHAALDGTDTLDNADMFSLLQTGLQYAILAVRHWGVSSACTCTPRDVAGNAHTMRDHAHAASTSFRAPAAQIALHNLAVVLVEAGVRLGWLQHDTNWLDRAEPPAYVALALQLFRRLRTDERSSDSVALLASDALRRLRGYVRCLRSTPAALASLRDAFALWSADLTSDLPRTFDEYSDVLELAAATDAAASIISVNLTASVALDPSAPEWVLNEEKYARLIMAPQEADVEEADGGW